MIEGTDHSFNSYFVSNEYCTFMDFKIRNKKQEAWTEHSVELKTDTSEMRMLNRQF